MLDEQVELCSSSRRRVELLGETRTEHGRQRKQVLKLTCGFFKFVSQLPVFESFSLQLATELVFGLGCVGHQGRMMSEGVG